MSDQTQTTCIVGPRGALPCIDDWLPLTFALLDRCILRAQRLSNGGSFQTVTPPNYIQSPILYHALLIPAEARRFSLGLEHVDISCTTRMVKAPRTDESGCKGLKCAPKEVGSQRRNGESEDV